MAQKRLVRIWNQSFSQLGMGFLVSGMTVKQSDSHVYSHHRTCENAGGGSNDTDDYCGIHAVSSSLR